MCNECVCLFKSVCKPFKHTFKHTYTLSLYEVLCDHTITLNKCICVSVCLKVLHTLHTHLNHTCVKYVSLHTCVKYMCTCGCLKVCLKCVLKCVWYHTFKHNTSLYCVRFLHSREYFYVYVCDSKCVCEFKHTLYTILNINVLNTLTHPTECDTLC